MSAGIRSGVNWMRLNDRSRICATVLMSSVLARPGHAGDQAVPAGEERDEHLIDHRVLPDDDLADLGEDALAPVRDALGHGGDVVRGVSVVSGRGRMVVSGFID